MLAVTLSGSISRKHQGRNDVSKLTSLRVCLGAEELRGAAQRNTNANTELLNPNTHFTTTPRDHHG
jgi:hypothetical protein